MRRDRRDTGAGDLQHQINFTRDKEHEADRIGFQRLEAAGFDVNAMATFMERLQRATRFSGDGRRPRRTCGRTRSPTSASPRRRRARSASPTARSADSLDFHLVRALLRSYEGEPQRRRLFFDDALAERKFNNEVAMHYGLVASLLRAKDSSARRPSSPRSRRSRRRIR